MSASVLNLTPETTMGELVAKFPGAQRALFRGYHIGGCSSCGFQLEETLAQVCARNGGLVVSDVIGFLEQAQESDQLMEVSPAEADALVKAGKARMVDVRTREEFDAVHIEGSVPFSESLMSELPGWDRSLEIIFVCHHGVRSLDAAAYFAGHGMSNVRSLTGGIDAWSCEVDPSLPRYELA
ncbi:MAG: rhodanese-like domain-containing protein [Verrucomicrobiota bacterium]